MFGKSGVAAEFTSGVRYRPRIRRLLCVDERSEQERHKKTGKASLNSAGLFRILFWKRRENHFRRLSTQ